MYQAQTLSTIPPKNDFPKFNPFKLTHHAFIQAYLDYFQPESCEYNFANLFTWQGKNDLFWTVFENRVIIYDATLPGAFFPLGEPMVPEELVILSLNLKQLGLTPDFHTVPKSYIAQFSELEKYYQVSQSRDSAEYIYDVAALCELKGKKLRKKRNLISQFKKTHPEYRVHSFKGIYIQKAFDLVKKQRDRFKEIPRSIQQEFYAIKKAFEYMRDLNMEGLVLEVNNKLVAFSLFSPLSQDTYDIQFEKSDHDYKGSAQIINQETACYLKDTCRFLNREQDMGIKGLRKAKLSYAPEKLIIPYTLIFSPKNTRNVSSPGFEACFPRLKNSIVCEFFSSLIFVK